MSFLFKLSLIIFILSLITFGFSYYLKTNTELKQVVVMDNNKSQNFKNPPSPSIANNNSFNLFQNQNVKIITPVEDKRKGLQNNPTLSSQENLITNLQENTSTNDDELITIQIIANEFKFEPNIFKVKENQQVKIIITNQGLIPHNFKIEKDTVVYQTSLIAPGEQAVLEFKAPSKGEYDFYCTLDDHKLKGMFGKMIVE